MSALANKFLLVSGGSIGRRHARNLAELFPTAQITFLHLTQANSQTKSAQNDGFGHVYSLQEALALKADMALICSPAPYHLEIAQAFCESGIPLFIEKPTCETLAEVDQLISYAERYDVPVSTGYNLRYEPCFSALRAMLADKVIGEIYHIHAEVGQYLPHWRPHMAYENSVSAQRTLGGGALLELSHEIDYLCALFGPPDQVMAHGGKLSTLSIDVEDCVDLSLTYQRPEMLVHVHLDFLQHDTTRYCKLIGSEGTLYWDLMAKSLWHYSLHNAAWEAAPVAPFAPTWDTYKEEMADFVARVQAGNVMKVPLTESRHVNAVIDAARQSLATKQIYELAL